MLYYQEQQSIESSTLFKFCFLTKLLAIYIVVIAFVFSCSLALHHLPIAATVVESILGCHVLLSNHCYCIRSAFWSCKSYLIFVIIAFVFSCSLALHHLLIAAMIRESALGCLVLLSNCCHCIWSALSNCKGYLVFLLLLLHCGILAFCLYKYQLNSFCLRLRIDLKKNKSLITSKSCHGWHDRSPFVSTHRHFSLNLSFIPKTRPADFLSV